MNDSIIDLKEDYTKDQTNIDKSSDSNSTKYSNTERNSLLKEKDDFHLIPIEKEKILNKEEFMGTNIKYEERLRIGNMWAFWYKDGEPRILIGPHWPFYLCLTSFISFICFIYFYALWDKLNIYIRFIGISLYLIQTSSYLMTVLINPGLPKKEMNLKYCVTGINFKNFRICNVCNVIMNMDEGTSHCEDCNVCIEGHDHHCPWTTKCVGKGNLKPFYTFVSFTFVLMGFLFFGLATSNV